MSWAYTGLSPPLTVASFIGTNAILTLQHLDSHCVQTVALADAVDRCLDYFPEGTVA